MALLSGFELLFVLLVVGFLFLLGVRLRTRSSTIMLVLIVGLLLVGLISLSKLTMALFGAALLLGAIVVLLVLISFRRS
jgi:hypothetical protein